MNFACERAGGEEEAEIGREGGEGGREGREGGREGGIEYKHAVIMKFSRDVRKTAHTHTVISKL